jgi:lipoprotein NlpI
VAVDQKLASYTERHSCGSSGALVARQAPRRFFGCGLRLQPTSAGAYSNLGAALRSAGQPEAALEAISTALKLNPQYAQAWLRCTIRISKIT